MILIGHLDSPYVRRVAVTLHTYGIAFERRALSVFGDQAELRGINPLGKVPALQLDDGETLVDSYMIIDHLDAMAGPDKALTPAAGAERRRVQQLTAIALGVGEKSIAASPAYRRATGNDDADWADRCRTQITSGLHWLTARQIQPWLNGETMTQADIALTCAWSHLVNRIPEMQAASAYPALAELAARAEALPAFQAYPFQDG